MSVVYSPVFSKKTRWILGVIDNHQARPLTENEVAGASDELNRRAAPPASDALRAVAEEVYQSIPATYDEEDPMVRRHGKALLALGVVLEAMPGTVTRAPTTAASRPDVEAIMAANGHPDERPCVVCGAVFDTHDPRCVFDRGRWLQGAVWVCGGCGYTRRRIAGEMEPLCPWCKATFRVKPGLRTDDGDERGQEDGGEQGGGPS